MSNKDRTEYIREKAEDNLAYFAQLVNPLRYYGEIHIELFNWATRDTAKDCQLVLLPRDHQKSHCAAVYCAWVITKDPSSTHLYISATEKLAVKQLYAVKQILESDVYRRYWPDMIHPEEGKRKKWSEREIIVDHPERTRAGVRDSTVFAAGLTATITGLHCTHIWLDDLVEPNNAYTEEGRTKVANLYSQLASIETTGSREFVVGTRYFPTDLYKTMIDLEEEVYDENIEVIGTDHVYEVFERVVETDMMFLWPKAYVPELNKWFGFDEKELARKKAKYIDRTQFYAQYYNNPNDSSLDRISRDKFQYYDRSFLSQERGLWYINGERLNIYAAIDFAFTLNQRSDYSAIVVVGITSDGKIYVLDIDRFKTDKISVYYSHLFQAFRKWNFRKARAECTQAQSVIVKDLRDNYIVPNGLALTLDPFHPTRHLGSKEERVDAILEPRYDNLSIYHYKGGFCQELEDEIVMANPPHDDIKDALASAIDVAVPPTFSRRKKEFGDNVIFHPKFGGVTFRNDRRSR